MIQANITLAQLAYTLHFFLLLSTSNRSKQSIRVLFRIYLNIIFVLASEPLLSNSAGRAEQISPDPIILKRYTDGLNHFQCKENIQWHILTLMWIIIVYLLRYFSMFSYSCWIMRLRRRRLFFFLHTGVCCLSRMHQSSGASSQSACAWATRSRAKNGLSRAYNEMRTRHTPAKTTDFAECFWYFEKAIFNYSITPL